MYYYSTVFTNLLLIATFSLLREYSSEMSFPWIIALK